MKQKRLYKLAVFLHIISSLFATFAAFSALLNGPTEQGAVEGVPQVVVVLSTMLGVAGLASAYGLWQGQKWAIWLTILIQALNGLLSLPGIIFAPTRFTQIAATTSVLIPIFIIFVLLQREKRPL